MAVFQWPVSKTELINSALSQTGNNLVSAPEDGTDEWNVCSPAYERALAVVTEGHDWSWLTEVRPLQRAVNAPADTNFDAAFAAPPDLVHLIRVMVDDRPCPWDLLNNQIVVLAQGGAVTIKGIFSTRSDIVNGSPTVVFAMEHFIFAAIARGLRKDSVEAARLLGMANAILEKAKSRHDMQKPKRAPFRSRMTAARRGRRPLVSDRSDGW